MTLLSLVNEAQDILSVPTSTVVVGSTDDNVRMLRELANQEGRQLARSYDWEALSTEDTFTSVASAAQTGVLNSDFDHFIKGTMFNRTNSRRVAGPLTGEEWQSQQALSTSLLTDAFRVQGGVIQLTPTPDAGDTYAFEYISKNWCQSSGGTGQSSWQADEDVGLLDEDLMLLGVIWRFRKARGFDYAEEFNTYEEQKIQFQMRDGGKRTINYGNDDNLFEGKRPPLVIEGSWPL